MGRILSAGFWGETLCEVRNNGTVYDGTGLFANAIGEVDDQYVYKGTGLFKEKIGMFDEHGNVYRGTGLFREKIGRIDAEGNVYAGTGWGEEKVARVEPPFMRASGAAYLLLCYRVSAAIVLTKIF